jgi:hypothetical protein
MKTMLLTATARVYQDIMLTFQIIVCNVFNVTLIAKNVLVQAILNV